VLLRRYLPTPPRAGSAKQHPRMKKRRGRVEQTDHSR